MREAHQTWVVVCLAGVQIQSDVFFVFEMFGGVPFGELRVGMSGVLEVVVSAFESFAQDLAVVDSGLFAERVEPCGDSDVLAH